MSRRRRVAKREMLADPKYGSTALTKFVNHIMANGKKAVAEKIVYGALDYVQAKKKGDPIELFLEAIDIVSPQVEVRPRRIGGATYQVPVEVRSTRKRILAMRTIVTSARKRREKTMIDRLGEEFLDVLDNKGASIKKRDDMHKMAEANRAFSHYRFS